MSMILIKVVLAPYCRHDPCRNFQAFDKKADWNKKQTNKQTNKQSNKTKQNKTNSCFTEDILVCSDMWVFERLHTGLLMASKSGVKLNRCNLSKVRLNRCPKETS